MYRVLVPVDVSVERATRQAETVIDLASDMQDVEAIVIHVHEEIDTIEEEGTAYVDELNERLDEIHGRPESVDVVVDRLDEHDIDSTVHELIGTPAEAILELADEFDVDAILLGVRKRSPVGKVLFGSVTQAVILDSSRPVITVPASGD